jgi:hypothetical protein
MTPAPPPRRARAGPLGRGVVIYEWQAGEHFLAPQLLPAATCIHGAIDDSAAAVLAQLPPRTEAFLFQINLSRTARFPAGRQALVAELAARGVRVLNRSLTDIRKHTLHRLLRAAGLPSPAAGRRGRTDELLIVKTDFNYGGMCERLLTPAQRRRLGLSPRPIGLEDWADYRILPRGKMLDDWWHDETLVVERYIDNPRGEFFRVCVLGESVMVVKAYNECPIKKLNDDPRDENFLIARSRLPHLGDNGFLSPDLLATIDRFLAAAGLDFGALDIVHDGRRFFIVDLNATPYGSRRGAMDPDAEDHLRRGLIPHGGASAAGSTQRKPMLRQASPAAARPR